MLVKNRFEISMHEYEWMQGERRFFTNKSKTQIKYTSLHCVLQDHPTPEIVKMVQFLHVAFCPWL